MRDLGWSDFLWTTSTDFSRMYHWVSVRFASISQLRNSKHSLFLSELVKTWKGLDPLKTEKTQNLLGAPPEGFSWRAVTPVSQFSIDPLPGLWGRWVLPCTTNRVCCGYPVLCPNKSICSSWTFLRRQEKVLKVPGKMKSSPFGAMLGKGRDLASWLSSG